MRIDYTASITRWTIGGHAVIYLVTYNVPIGDGRSCLTFALIPVRRKFFAAERVRLFAHPPAGMVTLMIANFNSALFPTSEYRIVGIVGVQSNQDHIRTISKRSRVVFQTIKRV